MKKLKLKDSVSLKVGHFAAPKTFERTVGHEDPGFARYIKLIFCDNFSDLVLSLYHP